MHISADCIGTAFTDFPKEVRRESDLIRYIQRGGEVTYGGTIYSKTTKDKIGKWNAVLVQSFCIYNKTAENLPAAQKKKELKTYRFKNRKMIWKRTIRD